MKILALDLETTGLLHERDAFITEIGAVLFSAYSGRVLESFGGILQCPPGKPIPPHITLLTKMTDQDCGQGMERSKAFDRLIGLIAKADAILTKNGVMFDVPMVKRDPLFTTQELPPNIDIQWDIQLPASVKGRSQNHIACDLGFLNPFPHQALPDCLTMIEICRRSCVNWERALESAKSPLVEIEADVSFAKKDLAKNAGFIWNKDRGSWGLTKRKAQIKSDEWRFPWKIVSEI